MPDASQEPGMELWTIYDHPSDWPDGYIARKHLVIDGTGGPTPHVLTCEQLEPLREQMRMMGLACLTRSPEDDPVIVETWL